jgi:hypothetical protein
VPAIRYLPAIRCTTVRSYDFRLFGMLKGILKDHEFNSSDEIEEAITTVWDILTVDNVHSVLQNWMSRLAWAIENGGEYAHE